MRPCLDSIIFPYTASVYYAVLEQDEFGNETETWVYDRDIMFMPQSVGDNSYRQDMNTGMFLRYDEGLTGRTPSEVRKATSGILYPITEIALTNITNQYGEQPYMEFAGPRAGLSTVFEVKTIAPSFDPFGHRDYFKLILGRMQDQTSEGIPE